MGMLLSGNKLSSGYKSIVLEANDISQIYIIQKKKKEESRDENRLTLMHPPPTLIYFEGRREVMMLDGSLFILIGWE